MTRMKEKQKDRNYNPVQIQRHLLLAACRKKESSPDGLGVDVNGSDSLQQKLHHFQEWIAGLFGAAQLFSDVSLE